MEKIEALRLYNSGWWEDKTAQEIVAFQLYESRLCLPFDVFHKSIEEALGRSVWTHEFADQKTLQTEFEGNRGPEGPLESFIRIMSKGEVEVNENTTNS